MNTALRIHRGVGTENKLYIRKTIHLTFYVSIYTQLRVSCKISVNEACDDTPHPSFWANTMKNESLFTASLGGPSI